MEYSRIGHGPDARVNTPHHFADSSIDFGPIESIEDDYPSFMGGETSCLLRFLLALVYNINVLYIRRMEYSTLESATVRTLE